MAKIFTKPQGLVVHVGKYGPAGNDVPAVVPESVAKELAGDARLRVEIDAAPAPSIPETKKRAPRAQEEN